MLFWLCMVRRNERGMTLPNCRVDPSLCNSSGRTVKLRNEWPNLFRFLLFQVVITTVAWSFNQVACALPHSFAWTSLVSLYGFSHRDKFDHSNNGTFTFFVPIIQLILLSGITILSCCFIFFGGCRESCLRIVRFLKKL